MIHCLGRLSRSGHARIGSSVGRALFLRRCGDAGPVGSSAAHDPFDRQRDAGGAERGVRRALRGRGRAAVDPAGDAAPGDAAAGVLHDPLGAPADGAARVRPLVPLVRRALGGRAGLGPFDLLEEPRPAAGRRDRREVPRRGADPAQGEAAAVEPALQRRRDPDRGLGEPEVVQAEAGRGRGEDGGDPPEDGAGGGESGGATPRSTSRASGARTRRIARPPTRRRCSTARARAWRRGSATSATG